MMEEIILVLSAKKLCKVCLFVFYYFFGWHVIFIKLIFDEIREIFFDEILIAEKCVWYNLALILWCNSPAKCKLISRPDKSL